MKNIYVIGAGFSGISSATYLASQGHKVTILEKNDLPGGRARKLEENNYIFDMGPSWYWMPDIFEKYFQDFGKKVDDYYELIRLDPGYRIYYDRDDQLDIPADINKLYEAFDRLDPGSSRKLKKFLKHAEYKYHVGIGKIVYLPSLRLREFLRLDLLTGLLRMSVLSSISSVVKRITRNEKLIRLLEFPVLFLGALPQNTPALYSLMNYADLVLGTWYPRGGMFRIVEGMVKLAEEKGVKFLYNTPVTGIKTENGIVTRLFSDNREFVPDIVIGSADYHHLEQDLIPEKNRKYSEEYWQNRVMAPSAILFYLGLNKKLNNLLHHNLFFDVDFYKHAREIYDHPQWPENPAIYVSCTSKTDDTVAPEGHENLTILIPVAPGLNDTSEVRESLYDYVISKVEKITGESNLKDHITYKKIYAQSDFIRDYNSFKGNAYGLANTLKQTAVLKPKMKHKKLDNFYFAGQLTVPGPGVPPSLISGKVVSRLISKHYNS